MIIHLFCLCVLLAPSQQQDVPLSPCPNVFQYEPPGTEPGRWYGNVNLSTDSTLHSLWLNIVLDRKADILGNWIGDVTTTDNIDFKIENTNMKIHPGPAVAVRFFVQYNTLNPPTPKLKTIRLNGREICNADNRLPAVGRPDDRPKKPQRPTERPYTERPLTERPYTERPITERPATQRPITERPATETPGPIFVRPVGRPNTMDIGGGGRPSTNGIQINPRPRPNSRPDPDEYDNGDSGDGGEGFPGGLPVFVVPDSASGSIPKPTFAGSSNSGNRNPTNQVRCGSVVRRNPSPLVLGGTPTYEGQWPWQIALYQSQIVDLKYICGGTLVSDKHVITAAHCVTVKGSNRLTNKNTLTVHLGKHNLRTSVDGVQIRLVAHIHKHPDYNASSYQMDLGILVLREPVAFTEWVRPVCLWPENDIDINNLVGRRGSVVGWGFDDTGVSTEELSLVEMPVVSAETCLRSYSVFFERFTSEFSYCAGYRNGSYDERTGSFKSTSVCNGDSGGGMVFNIDGFWYLRGLVSLSVARQNEYRCDPSHYVVFTDIAKFLPWIRARLNE